jgi:hypothetical protein
MGLTCSSAIVKEMGGDIILKDSRKGFTNFAFKFPVKVSNMDENDNQIFQAESKAINNELIEDYLRLNDFQSFNLRAIDLYKIQEIEDEIILKDYIKM